MMKILKLLAFIGCLSLCACSSGDTTSENSSNEASVKLWEVQKEVDEFGDEIPDGASIVMAPISGDFSNTATSGSELTGYVTMQIREGYPVFAFVLMEYGDHQATYTEYDMMAVKTKIGENIYEYKEILSNPPNGLIGVYDTWETLYTALYTGTDVRCIIEIESSQYNFTIMSADFADACKESGYVTKAMYYHDTDNEVLLEEAKDFIENGSYEEAIDILKYLKDNETLYSTAKLLIEKKEFNTAITILEYLRDYSDSRELLLDTVCRAQLNGDNYEAWKDIFMGNMPEPLSGDELKKIIVGDWYHTSGDTYTTYTENGEYHYFVDGEKSEVSDGKWSVDGEKLIVDNKYIQTQRTVYPFYKNAYIFCTDQTTSVVYEMHFYNGTLE